MVVFRVFFGFSKCCREWGFLKGVEWSWCGCGFISFEGGFLEGLQNKVGVKLETTSFL